jgi:hypothetical protein
MDKLRIENFNKYHTCSDQKMAEWCVKHMRLEHFHQEFEKPGFCWCCYEEPEDEDEEGVNNSDDRWVCYVHPDDEEWEEWMNEINPTIIAVYYCGSCHEWAIDDELG